MPKTALAPKSIKLSAQQVLNDLLKEKLIPFELTAYFVESVGPEQYIVRFQDSRMHSVDVLWRKGQSFTDIFRAAVLERVSRMSGPLTDWRPNS